MPYNYLLDYRIRENYKIDYANSVIIIDEAHNIERVAEDVASFDISLQGFNSVLTEMEMLTKALKLRDERREPPGEGLKCKQEHALDF